LLAAEGKLLTLTGIRVSSSVPVSFFAITIGNEVVELGSTSVGSIDVAARDYVALYYVLDELGAELPMVVLIFSGVVTL